MRKLPFAAFQSSRPMFCFFLAPFVFITHTAPVKEARKISLIEDQTSAPAIEAVAREFEADLISKSPEPLEFYRESLDTILSPDSNYHAR